MSFNCKSLKRSINGVRKLCRNADIVLLQELWLLSFDLPILSTIDSEFGWTGKSAVDISAGLLKGRPYGGVGILYRKSAFQNVTLIECNSDRIVFIKVETNNTSFLVASVYMPTDSNENLPLFTETLGVLSSTVADNCDVQAVFMLGDFNAHTNEPFYREMVDFCTEQQWICADVNKCDSETYTYISEVHGCRRWLDHCIVTSCAYNTIHKVTVLHDVLWSDHFPVLMECKLDLIKPVINNINDNFKDKVIWGERRKDQINEYTNICNNKLKEIDFPASLRSCCDGMCHNVDHRKVIDSLYENIINALKTAAIMTSTYEMRRKFKCIAGWNTYVAEAHGEARLQFQLWELAGKPWRGAIFERMQHSKKIFKAKLKWCQDRQEQIKMDKLALAHKNKQFRDFWKGTKQLNVKPGLPESVGGKSDCVEIAELFREHFSVKSLLHPNQSVEGEREVMSATGANRTAYITAKQINMVISSMQRGKSPGHDSLSVEHFKYAGVHISRVLSVLFNLCVGHSYLPEALMRTIVVPVVKNKTGDLSDRANYRPISLATTTAKILDRMLDNILEQHVKIHDAQFGFRAGLSTDSAILCLKHTVRYFTDRKTPVYACFLDLSKAFDRVDYPLLWQKLSKTGIPGEYVALFRHWYNNQLNQVRWSNMMSSEYKLECGVRQGGITSPKLFNLYINELIVGLSGMHAGCYVGSTCINNLSYADDMVLLAPSISALEILLRGCENYALDHGLEYNPNKSEVMVFKAGKIKPYYVPPIVLRNTPLRVVDRVKYLGHILTSDLSDDPDIERERRALAVRSNMLARRFARCTCEVKITLFKAYSQSFYTSSLWTRYTKRTFNALRIQYNNAFRMLMGLPKWCSASGMFAEARTDGFQAIMRKRIVSIWDHMRRSPNSILNAVAGRYDCSIQRFWMQQVKGEAQYLI